MNKLDKHSTVNKKQKRIVSKHLLGDSNVEIGKVEYPSAKLKSQRQIVYQQLKKPKVRQYMEQAKLQAMKEYNIGWDRVMKVIDKGLEAKRSDNKDDINTQLRAAKQASDYLELPKATTDNNLEQVFNNLPGDLDEIELQKAVFRVNKD